MAMNSYQAELATLVGEETMNRWYKMVAEEVAYSYQAKAWSPLVMLLTERGDVEVLMRGLDENLRRHRSDYCILKRDLREQIKEAVAKVVVDAYAGFLHANTGLLVEGRAFLPPDSIKRLLGWLFDGGGGEGWRREMAVERERGTVGSRPKFKSRGEESFGSKSTLRSLCDEINSFVFIFLHCLSGGRRARRERLDRSPSTVIIHQFFPLVARRRVIDRAGGATMAPPPRAHWVGVRFCQSPETTTVGKSMDTPQP